MKTLINTLLLLCLTIGLVMAKDGKGIKFLPQETKFADIIELAKKENKLIFIDAYTTWCGPCKWMDKNVFSDAEVGNVFNEKFINAKFDMEKGEGIELAKKYKVAAYPSFLFINGDGQVVHQICGSSPKENFVEESLVALDEDQRLGAYDQKYANGNKDVDFLSQYLKKGQRACRDQTTVAQEYWNLIPDGRLATEKHWQMYQSYVNDIHSREFQYFLNHQEEFAALSNESNIQEYLERVIYFNLVTSVRNKNTAQLEKDLEMISSYNLPAAAVAIMKAKIFEEKEKGNWSEVADLLTEYVKKDGFDDAGYINQWSWQIFSHLDDKEKLLNTAGIMKKVVDQPAHKNYAYMDTYAALLLKGGNKIEGKKVANEAIELGKKEGADFSGTEKLLEQYK